MSRPELFIYWRCDRATEAEALKAAAQMQTALRAQHPGLQARLYRRTETTAEYSTLMETYAVAGAAFDPAVVAAIDAAAATALGRWCQGQRHVERFETVSVDPD